MRNQSEFGLCRNGPCPQNSHAREIIWIAISNPYRIPDLTFDAYAAQNVEIFGDDAYPPDSYLEAGKPKGIYVEILRKAFSQMTDYNVKITMVPWERGLKLVKHGEGVALFPPYYTEERLPWMNFSEPILKERVVVFGTPEKLKGRTKWPDDFFWTRIGLNQGFNPSSMGGNAFENAVKAKKIIIDEGKSNEACLKKLMKGRTDFYINDQMIDISPYKGITRGIEANQNYGHLGFTKNTQKFPYIPDFKNKFDTTIQSMKQSGAIQKIIDSHLK